MQAIDIGANIGFYTALLSRKVGNEGSVYAFEPHSMNYRRLLNATKKFKNVKAFDYAIGEKSGRIKLYLSDELNVDHQSYDIGEGRKYSEVECYALDDFFDSEFKANFIKIDIQGYDFHAMKGMDAILERSDKIAILGELWPYGLLKSGSSPKEYMDYLKNKGFVVQYFTNDIDDYENKIYDKFFYTDFIAFKNFIQP